jgi:hypothetical protein
MSIFCGTWVSFDPTYNCCIGIGKHATNISEGQNVAESALTFSTVSLSKSTASPQLLSMRLTQSWMMFDRPSGLAGRNRTSSLRNMAVCSSVSVISCLEYKAVSRPHIFYQFIWIYSDLFDEGFVSKSLSLDMIRSCHVMCHVTYKSFV